MNPTNRHRHAAGYAAAPALLIIGALLVSGLLFYFVTFRSQQRSAEREAEAERVARAETEAAAAVAAQPPEPVVVRELPPPRGSTAELAPAEAGTDPPVMVDEPGTAPATPGRPAPPQVFRQPEPLAAALRDALVEADAASLATMLGLSSPPAPAEVTAAPDGESPAEATTGEDPTALIGSWLRELRDAGWEFDPLELVGRQGSQTRFRLPARQTDPLTGAPQIGHLEFELQRQPDLTWRLGGLAIDSALDGEALVRAMESLAAASPDLMPDPSQAIPGTPAGPAPTPPAIRVLSGQPDALQVARHFMLSLLGQDYETARLLVATERVAAERLAGLCIVFEEGNYREVPGQLVATAIDGERAWIVAKVRSEQAEVETELGIEMERLPTTDGGSEWLVSGLNLSSLLGRYTSGVDGVPYVPIVEHPAGGESLVLFFDFDDADLHERAQRQLDIVARLLKADDTKTIRIGGHADARGTEDYNRRLSLNRAERVRRELLNLGVPVAQIKTEAFGQERPLSPNVTPDGEDNPVGRARNRRAEIYLDF